MPINWKTVESQERLLACLVASMEPEKPNLQKIAKLFGKGVTAGALGWQFKPIRDAAKKVIAEAENGTAAAESSNAAGKTVTAAKRQAPSKETHVLNGRVEKKSRKSKASKSTQSVLSDDDDDTWFSGSHGGYHSGLGAENGIAVKEERMLNSVEGNGNMNGSF